MFVLRIYVSYVFFYFFFFKQKTAYEMRISDWSSDVCSSDLTIAKLAGDVDVDGDAREGLEPIFGDHAGIKAGAAGDDGDAVDAGEVEIHLRQRDRLFERTDVGGEGLRDHGRLLENLLLHIMAVRPLFDRGGGDTRRRNIALDCLVFAVENLCAIAGDDDPVTFVELGAIGRAQV